MSQPLLETSLQLLQTLAEAKEAFAGITEQEWNHKPAPGKWSKKEILGHLIDSAANNHLRFVKAQLATDVFNGPSYEQDLFVSAQKYQQGNAQDLINLWIAYNKHLAHVIVHIDPAKLDLVCHIGNCEPVPLSFIITDYITHLRHHLSAIYPN
jgi:hypothetical protein